MKLRCSFSVLMCLFAIFSGIEMPGKRALAQTPKLALRDTLVVAQQKYLESVAGIAFSPDSQLLATIASTGVKVWEIRTGTLKWEKKGHFGFPDTVAFAPNGKILATGSAGGDAIPGSIGKVQLWNMTNGQQIAILKMATQRGSVQQMVFSPDSATLVTASVDHGDKDPAMAVQIWETDTGKLKATLISRDDDVEVIGPTLRLSPDGKLLAINQNDRVSLWEYPAGKRIGDFETRQRGEIADIAFSPKGNLLAAACPNEGVFLYNVADRTLKSALSVPLKMLPTIHFSPDGKYLVTNDITRATLWDLQEGKQIKVWENTRGRIGLSPNGKWLGIGTAIANKQDPSYDDGYTLDVWELSSNQKVASAPKSHRSVFSVTFAPDSHLLATKDDHIVKIWELR